MLSLYIREWDYEGSENCEVDLEAEVVDSAKPEKETLTSPGHDGYVVYEFTWEKFLYTDLQNKIISNEIETQFEELQKKQMALDAKLHSDY